MNQGNTKLIFFKGLNELRALAALGVVFHHIELYKRRDKIASLFQIQEFSYFIDTLGKNCVHLFFVLSGFLITYLLLAEIEKFQKIDIKGFYMRRVLRIWPLYYLIVFISFFGIPWLIEIFPLLKNETHYYNRILALQDDHFWIKIAYFMFFLSHVALIIFGAVVGASQSWSVSLEEQFYVWWGLLFNFFHKYILWISITIIIFFKQVPILANSLFEYFNINHYTVLKLVIIYLQNFSIEYMCIGAVCAYLYNYYPHHIKNIFKNKLIVVIILALLSLYLFSISFNSICFSRLCVKNTNGVILGTVILVIVVNVSSTNRILDFLGKISYGIYMYHPFVMLISFGVIHSLNLQNVLAYNILVYVMIIGTTVFISYLSYEYYEKFFLSFKHRFSKIKSGSPN